MVPINFWYQTFVANSRNLGGNFPVVDDVLSSHGQEIYLTTSLDKNYIEFKLQTDRNYYFDWRQMYLSSKLILVRGPVYESYNGNEYKKEHTE